MQSSLRQAQLKAAHQKLMDGELMEAYYNYKTLLGNYPDNGPALLGLALCLHAQERFDEALAYATRALATDANPGNVHLVIGNIHRKQRQPEQAEEHLYQALETSEAPYRCHLSLARLYLDCNDLEQAEKQARLALASDPAQIQSRLLLGIIHERLGSLEQAEQELSALVRADPENVAGHVKLGLVALRRKSFIRAMDAFKALQELKPHDGIGYAGQAMVLCAQEMRGAALNVMRQAVKLDPGHALSKLLLSNLLMKEGAFDEAFPLLKSIIRTKNSLFAKKLMADIYLKRQHFDLACDTYRAILRGMPRMLASIPGGDELMDTTQPCTAETARSLQFALERQLEKRRAERRVAEAAPRDCDFFPGSLEEMARELDIQLSDDVLIHDDMPLGGNPTQSAN